MFSGLLKYITNTAHGVDGSNAMSVPATSRSSLEFLTGKGAMMHSLSKLVSSVALVGLLALIPMQAQAQAQDTHICGAPTPGTPQIVKCDSNVDTGPNAKPYKVTSNGLSVTIAEDILINGVEVGTRALTIGGQAQNPAFSRLRRAIVIETDKVASGANGITVKSKGNIDAGTAIWIISKNHNDIKVEVTAGKLQSNQSAIKIEGILFEPPEQTEEEISHRGNIDVTLGGTAVIRGHPKQYREQRVQGEPANMFEEIVPRGIEVRTYASKGGNVNVALKDTAKIEGGIMDHGIYILDEFAHKAGSPAEIKVTTEEGTLIGSGSAEINKDGVYVRINGNHSKRTVTVVHNGKIYAKNSGFKIEHKHEENSEETYAGGTAYLTIGEKGEVHVSGDTEDNGGIYLNTPDLVATGGMRKQSVTVYGKVFGKAAGGSAIHLKGGGTVTIGRNAMLMPSGANDSYRTIKVTDPDTITNGNNLVVRLDRNFNGIKNIENDKDKTAFKYRTTGSGEYTDLAMNQKITLTITLDSQVPCGFYNDCLATKTDEFTAMLEPHPTLTSTVFSLTFNRDASFKPKSGLAAPAAGKQRTPSKRGKVYEAVPSVIWDMASAMDAYMPSAMSGGTASASNPLQLAQNGTMAVADPGMLTDRRTWGSIEVGSGERRLRNSMTGSQSYDLSYSGFAAGVDLPSGDGMMFRVGLHHRQGKADLTNGGRVKISGTGVGVGMARQMSGDLLLDGWAGVTKFDDIEVKSSEMVGGKSLDVNEKTEGTGYAIGMGISQRVDLDKLSLTQRGGLTWSSVSVDDYAARYMVEVEGESEQKQDKVSTGTSSGVTARYGALFEKTVGETSTDCCKLFGSLDIEHNFSAERNVKVTNGDLTPTSIKSEAKPTKMRLGFGGSTSWNSGRSAFSGAIYHTTSGSGDKITSGQIALSVRF